MLPNKLNPTHQSLAICTRSGRSPACLCWLHHTTHPLDGMDARISTKCKRPQDIAIRQSSARETRHPFILRSSLQQISLQPLLKGACLAQLYTIHGALRSDSALKHQTARQRDSPAPSHLALAVRCPDWLAVAAQLQVSSCSAQLANDIYPVSPAAFFYLFSSSVCFSLTNTRITTTIIYMHTAILQ